jgi:hypothetical protein
MATTNIQQLLVGEDRQIQDFINANRDSFKAELESPYIVWEKYDPEPVLLVTTVSSPHIVLSH